MSEQKMTFPITLVFSNREEGISGSLGPDTKTYNMPDGSTIETDEELIYIYQRNDLNGFLKFLFRGTEREVRQYIGDLITTEQVLHRGLVAKDRAPTSSLGDLF